MSKGSKRQSWRQQRNTYAAITRDIAAQAGQPAPISGCAPPPPLTPNAHERARLRREAERERLRAIARAALAQENEDG